jgi:hypothetical protein
MDYDEEGADGDLQVEEYGGELDDAGDGDDTDQQDEAALLASLDIPVGEYRPQLEQVVRAIGQSTVAKIVTAKK